jgi:hypothetical protein
MLLTAVQTREKLGIKTNERLKRIVATGALRPVNAPKPGAEKFFMQFDSRDVNAYLRSRANGHEPAPPALPLEPAPPVAAAPPPVLGLVAKLDTLDQQQKQIINRLDLLLALWQ